MQLAVAFGLGSAVTLVFTIGAPFSGVSGRAALLAMAEPPITDRVSEATSGLPAVAGAVAAEGPSPAAPAAGQATLPQPLARAGEAEPMLAGSIVEALRKSLYGGDRNPYSLLAAEPGRYKTDNSYSYTHLTEDVVRGAVNVTSPSLWVEVGSFVGNSAILTAKVIKSMNLNVSIVCIDPWTGELNIWSWYKDPSKKKGGATRLLHLDQFGHLRIYETFLANVQAKGHHDIILPIRASSIVGMRLLERLIKERRLATRPQVIYLDSAHEEGETLLELGAAWSLLAHGGALLGDDWNWGAVRGDVTKFVQSRALPRLSAGQVARFHVQGAQPVDGVVLINQQWIIFKA